MKNVFTFIKPFFPAILLILLIGGSSWQIKGKNKINTNKSFSDTTKPGNNSADKDEHRMRDLDEAMKELDEAMKRLNVEMKKLDGAKLEKEIKASMEKVDWKKIQVDVERAMKEAEVKMKDIDMSKLHKQMEEMQENLRKQELKMKINGEKIRKQVEESMKKAKVNMERAKVDMEKAKEEIKFMNEFTDELEKDGLINKKKGYKVEVKNGELYINGTKQSKEVSDKYRKYFKKDNFSINTNGDTIIEI